MDAVVSSFFEPAQLAKNKMEEANNNKMKDFIIVNLLC
jgi:hypothetical protein